MSFDKKDDELIRVVLRPVRGCATDSQYSDAYDRLTMAITTVRQEARAAAWDDAVQCVKDRFGGGANARVVDIVGALQNTAQAEAAANSTTNNDKPNET